MTEEDLITKLLKSQAVDGNSGQMADIHHKTAELLQYTLFCTLKNKYTPLYFTMSIIEVHELEADGYQITRACQIPSLSKKPKIPK